MQGQPFQLLWADKGLNRLVIALNSLEKALCFLRSTLSTRVNLISINNWIINQEVERNLGRSSTIWSLKHPVCHHYISSLLFPSGKVEIIRLLVNHTGTPLQSEDQVFCWEWSWCLNSCYQLSAPSNRSSTRQVPTNSKGLKSVFPLTFTSVKSSLKQIITNFNVLKVTHYILNVDFSLQGAYKDNNYLIKLYKHFGNTY